MSEIVDYTIRVTTADVSGAGTDADVSMQFHAWRNGKTISTPIFGPLDNIFPLENLSPHDDFEQGQTDTFYVGLHDDIGDIVSGTIVFVPKGAYAKGGRLNKLTRRGRSVWENGIVPFAVKGVSEQRQSCQVLVRTFHSRRIELAILQGRDG